MYDGVFFDGKEISSLNVLNASGHHKNIQVKQEHTVLVSEPQSAYLSHVTTQGKTAKEISDALLAFSVPETPFPMSECWALTQPQPTPDPTGAS